MLTSLLKSFCNALFGMNQSQPTRLNYQFIPVERERRRVPR